jgi:hypothetical protein
MNYKYSRKLNESVKEAIRRVVLKENVNSGLYSMEPTVQSSPNGLGSEEMGPPKPVRYPETVVPGAGGGRYELIGGEWYFVGSDGRYYWWDYDGQQWWDVQLGQPVPMNISPNYAPTQRRRRR